MINTSDPIFIVIFLSISGITLRTILVLVGQSWSKTFHYLATFILLPNIAYVVTTVIASNIALSLGMIGALSIVRFRHPVRSNLELTLYFALITLGIAAGVNIKFAFLLLITIFLTILGIEFVQKVLKNFGISLYQISFNEGITNNILEISAKEKIETIQSNSNLIESYYSKDDQKWDYKLVFKHKTEMDSFLKETSKQSKIITYKTSSVIN